MLLIVVSLGGVGDPTERVPNDTESAMARVASAIVIQKKMKAPKLTALTTSKNKSGAMRAHSTAAEPWVRRQLRTRAESRSLILKTAENRNLDSFYANVFSRIYDIA